VVNTTGMKHLLIGLLLLGTASAANLRIYPSFSEVRDPVTVQNGTVNIALPVSITQFLVPGSIDLEGVELVSGIQRLGATWLKTLEGQQVWLREGDKMTRVTLIRAEDLLIRDAEGRYRHVPYDALAFDQLPPRNPGSPLVQFQYRVSGGPRATLSYLTRGVTWGPRYTLRAEGSSANLTGLAELRNASEVDYQVEKGAELYAGDVSLNYEGPMPYMQDALTSRGAAEAAPAPSAAPKIGNASELRGLRRYELSEAFTLPAQSTFTLPFLRPKISFERYGALNIPFTQANTDGKLTRAYRIKADTFLPAGPITVRDEGRIVGQATVADTPAGEAQDFKLGLDPDLNYTRAVQVVKQDKNGASYRVTLTLENRKARTVRAEVTEYFGGNVTVEGQATRTPEGASVRVDVPAGAKVTRTYTISFKYGG